MKLPVKVIITTVVAPIFDVLIDKYLSKKNSMTVVKEKSKLERRYELQNLMQKGRPGWYNETEWAELEREYEQLKEITKV